MKSVKWHGGFRGANEKIICVYSPPLTPMFSISLSCRYSLLRQLDSRCLSEFSRVLMHDLLRVSKHWGAGPRVCYCERGKSPGLLRYGLG